MSLVQSRQYKYEFGQNTYHKTERGEKPFVLQSDPCANAVKYLQKRDRENVGYSFYHMFDDLNMEDTREEFLHRHFQPTRREQDIRRRKKYLYGKKSQRNRCCC